MKRENLLTTAVVLLLLLNLGTLAYLIFGNNHRFPPPPPRVDKVIIETLNWNEDQQKQFEKLKHEHRSEINRLDDENEELAKKYFSLLSASPIDSLQKADLESAMALIATKKADITFKHFEDLKHLCTMEQERKFDLLVPELINILIAAPPRNGPPPRRN